MKKMQIWGAVGCLLLGLSTCNRGGPTMPISPAQSGHQANGQPDITAGGILVTSSRTAYFIGDTETFAASLVSGAGTVRITDGTWATDTPTVATVNEAGLVTIVGQGFANISCTQGGLRGSKTIWGRVDLRGTWSGTYSIQRCELWGEFPDSKFCETHGGSGLPIELVLTQEDEARRGTIKLGDLSMPFVAKPELDGTLEMESEVLTDPYVTNVAIGCTLQGSEPRFRMMLYYYRGNRGSGQAMLTCDISLCKTGAGQ
jgi:hypothetical protein